MSTQDPKLCDNCFELTTPRRPVGGGMLCDQCGHRHAYPCESCGCDVSVEDLEESYRNGTRFDAEGNQCEIDLCESCWDVIKKQE